MGIVLDKFAHKDENYEILSLGLSLMMNLLKVRKLNVQKIKVDKWMRGTLVLSDEFV